MTPDLSRAVPPWVIAAGLIGVVVAAVLVAYAVLGVLAALFRRPASADGPSLAEQAEPLLRARRGAGRFDAKFDRLVDGTQLGITTDSAIGWILLVAVACTAAVYVPFLEEVPAGIAGLLGGLFTYLVFWGLRNRRRKAIQEQLPDGCFQLARSLRAGLPLPSALRETATYVPKPLAGCLDRLATALSLGESTRAAVLRVADDAEVTEFDLVTEVIALHAESGGNLPAMLDRLAASIRDRNQYRGYFRSVTALSRLAALFLGLAGPAAAVLYLIFQPEMFAKFVSAPEGQTMIGIAVLLEVAGGAWLAVLHRRQNDF
ncbi:MAG: type II secretion system F family protein [Gemmataceae bacterium]|nr:type II secretion system F family protein [Gemmataceae bacterium]